MNNQIDEIKEDVPEYRSVMLARPAMVPPISFASMAPALLKTRQSIALKSTASVCSSVWDVSNLPALPAHYSLGRNNVYVQCSAQEVANRICNFFKVESVSVSLCGEDKFLLRAETSGGVKLAVRLFADEGMTVVEVQRTAGCGFEFSQTAKGVCRSAQAMPSTPKRKLPVPSCIMRLNTEEKFRCTENGIRIAIDMLLSNRTDQNLLGLESLEQILSIEDNMLVPAQLAPKTGFLKKLISFVVETDVTLLSKSEERNFVMIQRKALAVLAIYLKSLSSSGKLSMFLSELGCSEMEIFFSALIGFLNKSTASPHEALYSVQCLQSVWTIEGVQRMLKDMDLVRAIEVACVAGAQSSILLETESNLLKCKVL